MMYQTKNDLSESIRRTIIGLLQPRLADAVDLATQAKQAHWNVKGPNFIALHELFDKAADEAAEYGDLIAERIVALGGIAEGTAAVAAQHSTLPKYPLDIVDSAAHVESLSSALAAFGKSVRAAIDAAAQAGDQNTADLFTEVSRGVDKYLWFVEAHAERRR